MKELYIKDANGNYIPLTFNMLDISDLEHKIISVRVGNDTTPANDEIIDLISRKFMSFEPIKESVSKKNNNLLFIFPHCINLEVFSKKDLEEKCICVMVSPTDQINHLQEIKKQIKNINKKAIIVPSSITVKEYEEIVKTKERIQLRKQQRHGGGIK